MSSEAPVIAVRGVSKRYLLGRPRTGRSLRQVAEDALAWPLRAPLRLLGRIPPPAPPPSLWALRDIDLEVHRGEVLGIIGKNGSGKSTLLKLLSRLTPPTTGELTLRGRIGSLLEVGVGFHYELSGHENVYLNGAIMGLSREQIDARYDDILRFAGVADFIHSPVKHYSSGMYMRLAFSVAAHLEPDVLLLDEVLAVGDLEFQRRCLRKVAQIRERGATILLVSHSMSPITDLCDRALWLDSGRIAALGPPREVVERYLTKRPEAIAALTLPEEPEAEPAEPEEEVAEEGPRVDAQAAEPERPERPWGGLRFDPPLGIEGVRALRAWVEVEGAEVGREVPYDRAFELCLDYEVASEGGELGLRVGYKLINERGQVILHAVTNDPREAPENVGEAGRRRARVRLREAWIAPGIFEVELGMWSPRVGHHVSKTVYRFEIVNPTVDSIGLEVLRPILDWRVE